MSYFYLHTNENMYDSLLNEYLIIHKSDGEIVDMLKWSNDGYKKVCSKTLRSHLFGDKIRPKDEVHIEDDKDELGCDGDCENCHMDDKDDMNISIDHEDDGMHGFTVTQSDDHGCSSYSYYSTDTIDGYTLKRLLDIFGV